MTQIITKILYSYTGGITGFFPTLVALLWAGKYSCIPSNLCNRNLPLYMSYQSAFKLSLLLIIDFKHLAVQ